MADGLTDGRSRKGMSAKGLQVYHCKLSNSNGSCFVDCYKMDVGMIGEPGERV
jgi:hypothetical protein